MRSVWLNGGLGDAQGRGMVVRVIDLGDNVADRVMIS